MLTAMNQEYFLAVFIGNGNVLILVNLHSFLARIVKLRKINLHIGTVILLFVSFDSSCQVTGFG